jgi:hypothetical protein
MVDVVFIVVMLTKASVLYIAFTDCRIKTSPKSQGEDYSNDCSRVQMRVHEILLVVRLVFRHPIKVGSKICPQNMDKK